MVLINELSPLQRMINSPGLDKAFEIIKREIPLTEIHEFPSGSICGDWEVPKSWEIKEAYIKDLNNNIITSSSESPLFVAPFSEEVEGCFDKREIENHLTTDKNYTDEFLLEHRNAYNFQLKDWGITLPYKKWISMKDDKYFVKISTIRKDSPMKVAEIFLQGETNQTICICAHIDELCNDDLSGCVVAIELIKFLSEIKNRKYSYQVILSPELIGTIFFAGNNMKKIKNTIAMLNLETVGAGNQWNLKNSLSSSSKIDKSLELSFLTSGIQQKNIGFFEGYGNDERIYSWPTMSIPSVAIQKSPFEYYHTSGDTPERIDPKSLEEAIIISLNFINILEKDYIPSFTNFLPPYLSKRDLYFDRLKDPENHNKYNNELLFNINGEKSVVDLCKITNLDFNNVYKYLEKYYKQELISKKNINWNDKDE